MAHAGTGSSPLRWTRALAGQNAGSHVLSLGASPFQSIQANVADDRLVTCQGITDAGKCPSDLAPRVSQVPCGECVEVAALVSEFSLMLGMDMYTENPGKDALRFTRTMVTNQLAKFTPQLYVRLTRQTGRGDGKGDPSQTADYFLRCFDDYREQLGLDRDQVKDFLTGKLLLEYGPGDVLGVALLMYAHGAEFVQCVDRFPLERVSPKNIRTYLEMLDRLDPGPRERAKGAFNEFGEPKSGFNQRLIKYSVTANGLIDQQDAYDLIISRAVLEHVNLLELTISDMAKALRPDGIAVHKVDLKSHGMDRYRSFDFLTWPEWMYRLMNSHKGTPNRWRVDKYKEFVGRHGLRFKALAHTGQLEPEEINRIRPKLATAFRGIPTDELSWLGFWMVLERATTEPASGSTRTLAAANSGIFS